MKSLLAPLLLPAALAAALPCAYSQPPPPPPASGEVAPSPGGPERFIFRQASRRMESVAFLGVATSPADDTLAAQLGLPEGEGLVVQEIMPGSPAAGVLQRHDILLKLDDQQLIDPRQFSVLVRNHKEGDEVGLTYIRQGKQATARVKLAKHEAPDLSFKGFPEAPLPYDRADVDRELALIKGPIGKREILIDRREPMPDGPVLNQISVNPADSDLTYRDDKGSLHLTIKDGKRSLVATDAAGKEIFNGPIDTAQQRKALPAEIRQRLERIEGMRGVRFETDRGFEGVRTRIDDSPLAPISLPDPPVLAPRAPLFD